MQFIHKNFNLAILPRHMIYDIIFIMKHNEKDAESCSGKEIQAGKSNADVQSCYEAKLTVWRVFMERESVIRTLNLQIENLSRLQPQYRLHRTGDYDKLKAGIQQKIQEYHVNVRHELDPHVYNLYRRYFD